MSKTIDRFEPIRGDETMVERDAAFNKLGANIDALHECVDTGFIEAKEGREGLQAQFKSHFLTVEGQIRALSDDVTIQMEGLENQINSMEKRWGESAVTAAGRADAATTRLDNALLAIGTRVGVGKEGEIKPLSLRTLLGALTGAFAVATAVYAFLAQNWPAIERIFER